LAGPSFPKIGRDLAAERADAAVAAGTPLSEAGGVTTEPPPMMPPVAAPFTPPEEVPVPAPAPAAAPPPAGPDV